MHQKSNIKNLMILGLRMYPLHVISIQYVYNIHEDHRTSNTTCISSWVLSTWLHRYNIRDHETLGEDKPDDHVIDGFVYWFIAGLNRTLPSNPFIYLLLTSGINHRIVTNCLWTSKKRYFLNIWSFQRDPSKGLFPLILYLRWRYMFHGVSVQRVWLYWLFALRPHRDN